MRKILKDVILQSLISGIIAICVYIISKSLPITGVVLFILLLLVIFKPAVLVLNKLVQTL